MSCAAKISNFLEPIIEKRKFYEANPDMVRDVLSDGEKRGKLEAEKTMAKVRDKMKMGWKCIKLS